MPTTYRLPVLALLWLVCSCNVINPPEKAPTYVHIDSFQFAEDELHDIRCAWVYYNNNPVGVFDLPATIPVSVTDGGRLQIAPGVSINGRNDLLTIYPFYTIDTTVLNAQPGKTVVYEPKTKYSGKTRTKVISDFEAGLTGFARSAGAGTLIGVTADSLTFEGSGSGAVFLNNPDETSTDSTMFSFPVEQGAAFIEITYKSSLMVSLGLQAYLGNSSVTSVVFSAGIKPSDAWRKFYFNVTAFTDGNAVDRCKLFIKTSVPQGQNGGRLLIDNIKLVSF